MRFTISELKVMFGVSFDQPVYTVMSDGVGALNVLEAARQLNRRKLCKVYQASSSEMYGKVYETPQTEATPFNPQSPYACAKVYAFHQTVNYRDSYDLYAVNGILFNHESERRGETIRHPKDHSRSHSDQTRAAEKTVSWESGSQARLGVCQRLCGSDVVDAATRPARRFRNRHWQNADCS